jgi:hypothetical protein
MAGVVKRGDTFTITAYLGDSDDKENDDLPPAGRYARQG